MAFENQTLGQSMVRLFMWYIPTRVIYAAAKLELADHIGDDGASVQDLAQKLKVDPVALYRVMRVLAGLGVLRQDNNDRFYVTPFGDTLRKDSPQSVRDFAIYSHEFVYELYNVSSLLEVSQNIFDRTRETRQRYSEEVRKKQASSPEFLAQPIDRETISAYTRWKYPNLPVKENLQELLIRDLDHSRLVRRRVLLRLTKNSWRLHLSIAGWSCHHINGASCEHVQSVPRSGPQSALRSSQRLY